jgi:hypothetical protein
MSDMYAIKASTLTALGDAVRNKTGKVERPGGSVVITKEYQYTVKSGTTDDCRMSFPFEYSSCKIKLLSYEGTLPTTKISLDTVSFDANNEIFSSEVRYSSVNNDYYTTLKFSNITPPFSYHIEITPYDSNGNPFYEGGMVLNTMTVAEMTKQLNELEIPKVEPIVLTDKCNYACAGMLGSSYIENYPDKITTRDITSSTYMFYNTTIKSIPFEINFKKDNSTCDMTRMFDGANKLEDIPNMTYVANSYGDMSNLFNNCWALKNLPYIYNAYPSTMNGLFSGCYKLKEIPEDYFDTWNFDRIRTYSYSNMSSIFQNCYCLKSFPLRLLNELDEINTNKSNSYLFYSYAFYYCQSIEELIELPVFYMPSLTGNMFSNAFQHCNSLRKLMFRINEDGTPRVANWKSQTIDLSTGVGFLNSSANLILYSDDYTVDKLVIDDATYQALKNTDIWWTQKVEYSRYNHDSAVETINSLPDTSAYLATAGGTNTIKFTGKAGSLTDGGAINTLTEEEIAVAAAKGWTVSLS